MFSEICTMLVGLVLIVFLVVLRDEMTRPGPNNLFYRLIFNCMPTVTFWLAGIVTSLTQKLVSGLRKLDSRYNVFENIRGMLFSSKVASLEPDQSPFNKLIEEEKKQKQAKESAFRADLDKVISSAGFKTKRQTQLQTRANAAKSQQQQPTPDPGSCGCKYKVEFLELKKRLSELNKSQTKPRKSTSDAATQTGKCSAIQHLD